MMDVVPEPQLPALNATPPTPAVRVLMLLLAAGALLLLFAGAMARVVTYDEDQYLAAGLLLAQGRVPYRDFALLHAPLYPYLLAAAFKLTGGWYLLTARVVTFLLSAGCGVLLWALVRRLGADRLLACVLLAACLFSPFLLSPLATARNDTLPLFLFLFGALLYVRAADGSWWGRFAAALLVGLAVEAKLTYLFGPAALLLHGLVWPRRRLPPVLAGLALAALPALVLLVLSGLEPMRFGLLDFHRTAPQEWYRLQGLDPQTLGAPARLQDLMGWLLVGGNLTLVALSAALALIAMARRRNWKRPGALLLAMLGGALVTTFLPTPGAAMYYAPAAALLACCVAHLDRITTYLADPVRKRVLFLVAALPCVPVLMQQGPEVVRFARGQWVGTAAHRTALAVRAAMPDGGPVMTLFPHLVMDANPIMTEFSTGPFVFRSGDLYGPELLARLRTASPRTLPAVAGAAAIYAGPYGAVFRTPMDQAMTDYAENNEWRVVLADGNGARLWLRPGAR